ncbi:ABC transporter ATP-binding protein [Ornithinimicrobium avium]|uniref:ABC transporter ATP-binding protein n=1 Tax=Ornithinimicrobium avium TaxID=2283195 RepID=A0A345NSU8_9MICO|nr:ABC transporter ATP-binding protein [Ornithinimicrobium avium]AXH98106.1 ABC transporter ATP-binding protein [Ornithinimicrobium avium]
MTVEVRDARVDIDGRAALAPVSFSVAPGRCLGVVGDNGAGKTTLLRVLAGLLVPTGGSAHVGGRRCDERDAAFRRDVAALVGPPPAARDLTVEEHLLLVARTWGAGSGDAVRLVDGLVCELGMQQLTDRFPHQLSTGQVQLLALALTLVRPSSVLLLDEPEHGLDDGRVRTVLAALRARREAGMTVVLATHDPRFVDGLGAEVLELSAA